MAPGSAPIVVVHGEALREIPPELAVFSVTVSASDRDKTAVVTRLTRRASEVGEILDRFGTSIERRETTGVQVNADFNRRGERAQRYSGTVTTTVTVSDFDPLGDLLAQLASGEQTAVAGPWWQLRPGGRPGAEVRREAVTDALERAREYADAVGARVDRIVEIADAEAGGGGHPMMMRAASFEMADEGFTLFPQAQTVSARVRLTVTITEPSVLGSDPAVS
ncbi:SIMPL domain-containing protein [Actinoplanes sp. CA-015351]|uniref:SIMPL domain-containing protein n=1 Tax=Actinoplanes sp. CA-015351 TaxID=3239897 RepID=UPI003D992254